MSLPATRADAFAVGTFHYQTGTPCKRGHLAPRQRAGGHCVECLRAYDRIYKATEAYRAKQRAYEQGLAKGGVEC